MANHWSPNRLRRLRWSLSHRAWQPVPQGPTPSGDAVSAMRTIALTARAGVADRLIWASDRRTP